jgi:hypothetical protein
VQIVVAQQTMGAACQSHQAAQGGDVVRPTVDQIAQHVQGVAAGREVNFLQQTFQGCVTALHVADQVKCHLAIVAKLFIEFENSWIFC